MARRFIVDDSNVNSVDDKNIVITGKEVKHIQVLRHNVGDEIIVNANIYKIIRMTRDSIELEYIRQAPFKGIPNTNLTLYIAVLKNDKMDYVVQKAVEIGVKNIVPFFSNNVIVKLDEKGKLKRKEKLQKIADEACKQCGRMDIVQVDDFISFKELKNNIKENDSVLFAYESSKDSLRKEINIIKENKYKNIGIIIGAEGGFTPIEAQELNKIDNVKCISLGDRILRADTAALNLISIIIYEMEEF